MCHIFIINYAVAFEWVLGPTILVYNILCDVIKSLLLVLVIGVQ